ncbi:hypothetical protein PTKIN_Ptkin02bG0035000 [Pterospermum kingtungense]
MIPTLVPVLFPCLYTIVSSSQTYNKYLRTKALSIVYACTSVLGTMSGVYQAETSALMEPMLKPWVDQFSFILEHPVQPEDPDDWSIRMEVLKCLNQFVQNFPSFTENEFMAILGPLWQTFVSSLRVYTRSAVEGTEDSYEGSYDSDGAEKSLDSFVIQLFEFLLTIVGSRRLAKVVANNIADLVYNTIAFLQLTEQQLLPYSVMTKVPIKSFVFYPLRVLANVIPVLSAHVPNPALDLDITSTVVLSLFKRLVGMPAFLIRKDFSNKLNRCVIGFMLLSRVQLDCASLNFITVLSLDLNQIDQNTVHSWSTDANQFVADEDDFTYNCRVSGALLLEEVATSCGREGIDAIINAARKRFSESQLEKAGGSVFWWRIREATLFALASLSEQLLEAEVSGLTKVCLGNLLEQMITEDMGIGVHEYPFLYARMFISVAKFSSVISCGTLEHFLHAAMKTIGMGVPPAVKVGACRALSQLLPEANKGVIEPQMMGLLSSLTDLLHQASDETLHLVLETLQAAIRAGHELSASTEPIISPIILNMWALHISDPLISIEAIEVLEAIKNSPCCIRPLTSRILPYLGPVLNKPQQQPDGLVAGSLDLLTMLLKNAPTDVVKSAYDVCFDAIIRIVLQSDDHSEMQNATECLASFVSGGRQELLAWGSDSGFTMRSLLDAASRLLDPDLESSGSLFVGSYILQLILHLPSQMGQHIQDLIVALVRRMQSASIAGLKSSLLLIFARLVHMSAPNVEQFISLLITIPAEGYQNAFVYVMSEWTKQQGEIQGAYQIKVTTSALALLLSTRHPELSNINVQGRLLKSIEGITTRSKAKSAPDQWTIVPLPAKILALLADALIEIKEQVQDVVDEDSDWEEIHEGDMESENDLLPAAFATPYGSSAHDLHLEAMAKAYNENQEDENGEDTLNISDPLNEINLANYLTDFFVKFSQSDRQLFDNLCQSLTPAQQNAIRVVLNR